MAAATLTINSRNYGAWSLRGWLLCRLSGMDFTVQEVGAEEPGARAELLLLSPSVLVPRLEHDGIEVWDTLAIAEYLWETFPKSGLMPAERAARARCRSVSGEMHAGFAQMRSALPMNIRARHEKFPLFSGARADIARIVAIWQDCLGLAGGPYLFGDAPSVADAMYAPVCTRFVTYNVALPDDCRRYVATIVSMPDMVEWAGVAEAEAESVEELNVEF